MQEIRSPMAATVVELAVAAGQAVRAGDLLAVVEAMKMEHELRAPHDGRVLALLARPGELLAEGDALLRLGAAELPGQTEVPREATIAPAASRPELNELREREALLRDDARPAAVARRHASGLRTARENVADLCDEGSFVEYGAYAYAAQARRRPVEELIRQTPADGMLTGLARVEGIRCAVLAYDATVLAGTQGLRNHQKTDRLLGIAHDERLPLVLFAEGGGGRPGDTDMPIVAGLHVPTFASFARLSGRVPLLGIAAGRCFAGNAALLGCCDLIVATRGSNIGMGGPAMIEGGGLGNFRPEDIGPSAMQHRNGVIDVLVADEAAAVAAARQYLSYFQGRLASWEAPDAQRLRHAVPENRLRAYDVRKVLPDLFDRGSLLELRSGFGSGILTLLARIEGRPIGVLANNPLHLGGAIDAEAADKAAEAPIKLELSFRAVAAAAPRRFVIAVQLHHLASLVPHLLTLWLLLRLCLARHPGERVHPWHALVLGAFAACVLHTERGFGWAVRLVGSRVAAPVVLEATHISTLEFVDLEDLKRHAVDQPAGA